MQCPYCETFQDIKGISFKNDDLDTKECEYCKKLFAFRTDIIFDCEKYEKEVIK
jgi:hypothetical protein